MSLIGPDDPARGGAPPAPPRSLAGSGSGSPALLGRAGTSGMRSLNGNTGSNARIRRGMLLSANKNLKLHTTLLSTKNRTPLKPSKRSHPPCRPRDSPHARFADEVVHAQVAPGDAVDTGVRGGVAVTSGGMAKRAAAGAAFWLCPSWLYQISPRPLPAPRNKLCLTCC